MEDIYYLHSTFDSKKNKIYQNNKNSIPKILIALDDKDQSLSIKNYLANYLKIPVTCFTDKESCMNEILCMSNRGHLCIITEIDFNYSNVELERIEDLIDKEISCFFLFVGEINTEELNEKEAVKDKIYKIFPQFFNQKHMLEAVAEIFIKKFGIESNKIYLYDSKNSNVDNQNAEILNAGPAVHLPTMGVNLKEILSEIEDSLIMQALLRTKGNKNQASKLLQLNRTTLIEKMKKRGLENL